MSINETKTSAHWYVDVRSLKRWVQSNGFVLFLDFCMLVQMATFCWTLHDFQNIRIAVLLKRHDFFTCARTGCFLDVIQNEWDEAYTPYSRDGRTEPWRAGFLG